eukprot:CAMPEP_0116540964 /NCGR_PEP_ID=MMETSP0397-20121206/230_1 /TAXON_ID=216820 /ORGANISM="Cyclophora tenuis, Strain ECT3854" /LENGTH=430 /DNA_ID=CAMNT_0004064875 /DNA_START=22 /DNA_END=1314 /DNA_ORIENTATION=-
MMQSHRTTTPRLVERNLPYNQSRNKLQMLKHLKGLRFEDWFHVALRMSTSTSLLILLILWTLVICAFALIYKWVDAAYVGTDCGLGPLSYGAYFAFSLETCTTVGYGLPGSTNAFFENCPAIQFAIYLQMVWSMLYNAFLFAFFFSRLGKCESRASQVIFSNKAIVCKRDGKWELQFRVTDIDAAHPIVEAHVRMYARVGTELIPLRIHTPDDILGGTLFLSWPTVVSHQIDIHSPLHPSIRYPKYKLRVGNYGLRLREADSWIANREEIICPICAETYGTIERLRKHVAFNAIIERHDGVPPPGSHQAVDLKDLVLPAAPTMPQLRENFPREIVVLVEGIDPLMSGTFQALQSYTIDDVSWGGSFADCVYTKGDGSRYMVCLELFHKLKHVPNEASYQFPPESSTAPPTDDEEAKSEEEVKRDEESPPV